MTTKTATAIDDVTATSALNAEYRRLALLANNGDTAASKKLMAVEDQIDAMARRERRNAAAAIEEQRLAAEAAEESVAAAQAGNELQHAKHLADREVVYAAIEDLTAKLATEVQLALACDEELWASALRCGWRPGTRESSRITNFIATALGREGAGLSDMATVYGDLRESSLTRQPTKES